jgi:hypothetical protein
MLAVKAEPAVDAWLIGAVMIFVLPWLPVDCRNPVFAL